MIWLCALATLCIAMIFLGRSIVYSDRITEQRLDECVRNGYTWGECHNVIVAGGNFAK